MGKTMPRYQLKAMRALVEGILTVIQRWEDKHADPTDPAESLMNETTTGLWQASQSMRALTEGESDIHSPWPEFDLTDPQVAVLGEAYAQELLRDPIGNTIIPMQLRRKI